MVTEHGPRGRTDLRVNRNLSGGIRLDPWVHSPPPRVTRPSWHPNDSREPTPPVTPSSRTCGDRRSSLLSV